MVLISPILNRELLTFLRRRRAFTGLLVFLLVMSAAVALCWRAGTAGRQQINRDVLSRNLFITITIAQMLIFSAYALILTCTKINGERDTKTLDILVTAPLSYLHIVVAKYVSALTVILLLVFASVPFLALCFILGGVGWQEALSAYHIIFMAVLAYGMVGIACSTVCRKNYVSLLAGFLIALFWYIGAILLVALFVETIGWMRSGEKIVMGFFWVTSPLGCYLGAGNVVPFPGTFPRVLLLALHTVFQLGMLLVAFVIAWRRFRSVVEQRAEMAPRPTDRWWFRWRGKGTADDASRAARRGRRYKTIGDKVNPVFAREDRLFLSRRWKHRLIRYAVMVPTFLAVCAVFRGFDPGTYRFGHMQMLGFTVAMITAFLAPLMAARAVTSERETGSLALLVVTPLGPSQVLLGKLAVVIKHVFRAVIIGSFLLLFSFKHWPAGGLWILVLDWLKILLPLFVITLYLVSVGLLFSVICRRTVTAIVLTYGTLLVLAFSPVLFALVVAVFGMSDGPSEPFKTMYSFLSPLVSPCIYFISEREVNHWHENDQWGVIIGYSTIILIICGAILGVASAKFRNMFYASSQPPSATEPR